MVQLLFTRGKTILSSVICSATESMASHMAVHLVREHLVYHFLLDGLVIDTAHDFLSSRTVMDQVGLPLTDEQRNAFVSTFLALTPGKAYQYDYAAFAWWAWQALIYNLTGKPVQSRNDGNQRYAFLCTELLYMVNEAYAEAAHKALISSTVDLALLNPDEVAAMVRKEIAR